MARNRPPPEGSRPEINPSGIPGAGWRDEQQALAERNRERGLPRGDVRSPARCAYCGQPIRFDGRGRCTNCGAAGAVEATTPEDELLRDIARRNPPPANTTEAR